jgi:hypothetical protein
MKALELFYECWLEVTKQKRYHDKWLTDETYFRAIKAQFPTVESLALVEESWTAPFLLMVVQHLMTSRKQIVLGDSNAKQEAMIPSVIPTGMYGDTM